MTAVGGCPGGDHHHWQRNGRGIVGSRLGLDKTVIWLNEKKRFHSKIFYSLGPSQNENFCSFSLCILPPHSLRPAIFFQTFPQLFIPWTQPDDLLRLLRIEYHILIYSGSRLGTLLLPLFLHSVVVGVAKLFNSYPYKIIYECRTVNSVCVCKWRVCVCVHMQKNTKSLSKCQVAKRKICTPNVNEAKESQSEILKVLAHAFES